MYVAQTGLYVQLQWFSRVVYAIDYTFGEIECFRGKEVIIETVTDSARLRDGGNDPIKFKVLRRYTFIGVVRSGSSPAVFFSC